MHPALPASFDSWAQVLTDWKVIGVVNSCPRPKCFAEHPELAAPFVAEISAAIREKQLRRRPVAVAIHRESVTEPTYDRLGGPGYVALRCHMEAAQDRYIHRSRSTSAVADHDSPAALRRVMEQFQYHFQFIRSRHEPQVEHARAASVRAFWAAHSARGLGDDFFNDLPFDHSVSRLSRIEPAWWWRSCFAGLQARLAKHHAAQERDRAIAAREAELGRELSRDEIAILVRENRPKKQYELTSDEVRQHQEAQVSPDELRHLRSLRQSHPNTAREFEPLEAIVARTAEHVFERETVVPLHEFTAEVLRESYGQHSLAAIKAAVGREDIGLLHTGGQVSTQAARDAERALVARVDAGVAAYGELGFLSRQALLAFQPSSKPRWGKFRIRETG